MTRTVIVGAGLGGVRVATELRHRGYGGEIIVIGEEAHEPYDRPPLSKDFLKGTAEREAITLLSSATAAEKGITLRLAIGVTRIDRADRQVSMSDGSTVGYDFLVLATGAVNRPLPIPGAELPGVWSLRGLDDAASLRNALADAERVVIIGGGFIGLEVAAAARLRGAQVTVIEYLPRVMARVLSVEMSQYFVDVHRRHGVDVRCGVGVTSVDVGPGGSVMGVACSDGTCVPADVVVVGVGVTPAIGLAVDASLRVGDGVIVDERLLTSDLSIYAIGDCAQFDCVITGMQLRIESVQNATGQARFVAGDIVARAEHQSGASPDRPGYRAVPWFWSEQFDAKLQIAGVAPAHATSVVRGDPRSGSFSVGRFVDDRLTAVESLNSTRDHLTSRKLLSPEAGLRTRLTQAAFADNTVALKAFIGP
ncbi:pyridine nucleotide-disulfide oxidoreductase [Mycobacterium sp. CBMA293]|uniref:NAD(P)/FAD-dependent oxidoreductase n=1 Tax=unclassified Mycolicibacterium TaxID=2636767 RepID=UPI0012DFDE45|nr:MULTISPECIES: FAD-dependent oxidoreductase [unclassified Mycolicibacterium]MUL49414.1 pyridine nucleotide-disulfide oxidoreductase [Mycolicibacterium sp. CBMA 360]MUL62590.1 pyridine nucleotide-disulfide oxidoreductase [Mycolicibacterium sp. CBMA 335]MUL69042.1 pyridine nucleotide-disulfide oxidoreductase [Mycolicibacterium sp. CBMA 311]MUL96981.1 pyridine nucleotide-disulfide oxidoreductase [Mycolicibacterium sp. CBMA 230]MUM03981.1 hypothetical protein [Mycolicibacterium sp. CBMA 213]